MHVVLLSVGPVIILGYGAKPAPKTLLEFCFRVEELKYVLWRLWPHMTGVTSRSSTAEVEVSRQ